MAVVKRVELQKDVLCDDCKKIIEAGKVAVKDRRDKKKGTIYFHTNHYKGNKTGVLMVSE
jgi:hypothetical protein